MINNELNIKKTIQKNLNEHFDILDKIEKIIDQNLNNALKTISYSLKNRGTLFICGNGGSASDSQHISSELICKFKNERPPIKAIALTTDSSIITSISNDFKYEDIFSRQIEALGREGDILLGISTSGESKNIINAFKKAKQNKLKVVGLLGKKGGEAAKYSDCNIIVPSESTARIQEMHTLIYHILCDLIEKELGYEKY